MRRRALLLAVGFAVKDAEQLWMKLDEVLAQPEEAGLSILEDELDMLMDEHVAAAAEKLTSRYLYRKPRRRDSPAKLDIKVAARVAQFTWYRYRFLPARAPADQLAFAFSLFPQVYAHNPDWVPPMIAPLFSADPAELPGWYGEDLDTLVAAARDLVRQGGDEYWRYAVGLAQGAVELAVWLGSADVQWLLDLLLADDPDSAFDVELAKHLADHHWNLYASAPPEVAEAKAAFAIRLFGRLHAIDPRLVPASLLPLYDRSAPETAQYQNDLSLLASCANALLWFAAALPAGQAEAADEYRGHAVVLIERARALRRRLRGVDPAVQATVASALEKLLDQTLDAALLDELDELAASFERAVLRRTAGTGTAGSIDRLREEVVRQSQAPRHGRDGTPGFDLHLTAVLASICFARYRFREKDGFQLALALALYERVHAVDPELVPYSLRRVFDPGFERSGDYGDDGVQAMVAWAADLFTYAEEQANKERTPDGFHRRYLEHAVTLARQALEYAAHLVDPSPATRAQLAWLLTSWYEHIQDEAVLDRAVHEARTALAETAADDPERLDHLGVLGMVLAQVAETRADPDALREVVGLLRSAIDAAGPEHPHLVWAAVGLQRVLTQRGAWNSGVTAVTEMVGELRPLLDLIPADNPVRKHLALGTLGYEMSHLFNIGDYSGMREKRHAIDRAWQDLPEEDPARDYYRLLSASYLVLDHMVSQDPALEQVLADYREVFDRVSTKMDPLDRADHLYLVTSILLGADYAMGITGVADEYAGLLKEAMKSVPEDSAQHRSLSAQLGTLLTARFPASGDQREFEHGIALLRDNLTNLQGRRTEITDPTDLAVTKTSLGGALGKHHQVTGDERSYQEAMSLLRSTVQDPEQLVVGRLVDAWTAGQIAARAGRWDDAVDVLAQANALSASLAWRGLDRPNQEQALGLWSGAANEAAAAAIRAGDPARAVELLEQGRAVLFHQTLDVRSDTRLDTEHPDLAARLEEIGRAIEGTRDRNHRHALAREWDGLVADIRARPGFDRFLLPPAPSALRPAAGQTVAIVNVADFGSDALLVTGTGVRAVALPDLTTEETRERVTAFLDALDGRTRATTPSQQTAANETIVDVLDWLWRTTAEPVLDALGHTGAPAPGQAWPHLHWCPTWLLTFLPFHAAAARAPTGPDASVLDRVVSSYAVSLRALRAATKPGDPPPPRRSLLVISMPTTPRLPPLPGARQEASFLSGLPVPTETLTEDEADLAAVRRALAEHAWAHFACHAAQDLQNPSQGRLFLHDHRTRPFTILDISRMRLQHAQLAYLSACETARGGQRLPDEALHLGGALQLAGYQHVIATLWPIKDIIAANVTAEVYGRLRTPKATLDTTLAATAVHESMRTQRHRNPDDPALWAGYVHLGP